MVSTLFSLALLAANAVVSTVSAQPLASNQTQVHENRTLDEIYAAALAEGDTVTVWHGGDEKGQQDGLKAAFEQRFPGLKLNITVDLSKYHDGNLDLQLAAGNVYIDSIILQTLHDYPRWKSQGALLNYAPKGFESIYPEFKDAEAAYYGLFILGWSNAWSPAKTTGEGPKEFPDYLDPKWKDKIVLTYPNDDDAVLFTFDLAIQKYGVEWFDGLLAQNPRWVRGTATPPSLIAAANSTYATTFTSFVGLSSSDTFNVSHPVEGSFVTWPQTGAILKDAPHPEGAKLLHNFMLSDEYLKAGGTWSVRSDIDGPNGLPKIVDVKGTNASAFAGWMSDRANVERLRFFFEDRIGTPEGLSPLEDDL
ncbi:periplasmic binding protein-like II [Byssothecium circinans]|uniref:Periplasmic binding protein-like II n=1 Tax=Byssothecium circinans TaxID=147558 RepID=A0A6A5TX47_9PLEO|nr:periplasmic binding protein-like II [Byssothecium circinans]